jgi:PhzF family phenazine biosynthesis protein
MKNTVYTLNVFAETSNGGNPAGVLINADSLSDKEMLSIANKVGFSETAFIMKSKTADYKLRYFTPNSEVDLCGHATIASFYVLLNLDIIQPGVFTIETNVGILNVEVSSNSTVYMDQKLPIFSEILDNHAITDSLNMSSNLISDNLPIQIVSTGLKDIFIPLKSVTDLNNLRPDFEKITQISKQYSVTGYHVFVPSSDINITAWCRNFAPLFDINEESATGSASGALSCYLYNYNLLTGGDQETLTFHQGHTMNQPSIINVILDTKKNQISQVRVGGTCCDLNQIEV